MILMEIILGIDLIDEKSQKKNREKYKVPHAILVLLLSVIVLFKLVAGILMILENGVSGWPMVIIYPFLKYLYRFH